MAEKAHISTLIHATVDTVAGTEESTRSDRRASQPLSSLGARRADSDNGSAFLEANHDSQRANRRRHTDDPRKKPSPAPLQTVGSDTALAIDRADEDVFPAPKGASLTGLIPRAPTGSEWSRSKFRSRDSDPGLVGLHDVLRDLDLHASTRKAKTASLQRGESSVTLSQPMSWEEDTGIHHHIWHEVDSREACHLVESQFCQEVKLFRPRRNKVRCSACKIIAHTTCVEQLYYVGVYCKPTFREIKQKVENTTVLHHFLPRRRIGGRCKKCEKGFGNWMKLSGREIVGTSCSWCGDSYHMTCFSVSLKGEPCHLGPLRDMIVPPSWIVKIPVMERHNSRDGEDSGKSTGRRKSRRSRRKKADDKETKFFTVKPLSQRQHRPLLVFINPRSGGNQGSKLMQVFQWLLNPRQVFDLTRGGPTLGLKMFRNVSNFRILACGGDGTAGWVLSVLDTLEIKPPPPVAVLPLGTGNDLSRVLGWGAGYSDEPLDKILMHVLEGPVVELDRWHLSVWENPNATECDGDKTVPLHVVNNYFSIGADAHVALEFHLGREANPEQFNTRIKNKKFYTMMAGKSLVQRKFSNMTDHLQLFGDGEDLTKHIRHLKLEAIIFLNISSYGSGTHPWGNPSSRDPKIGPLRMDDGKIEILGLWASTFPKLLVGAHGERIAQCEHVKLVTDRSFPVQIDGEACKLQPSVIEVGLKNKALMVRKVPRKLSEAPLTGVQPSDRIKLSVSKVTSEQYERLHFDITEIRQAAVSLGLVVTTAQDTLSTLRPQVERFCNESHGSSRLASEWVFLDVATTGRVNRMFKVLPDQEESICIADILSDGIMVVEIDVSPTGTPTASNSYSRNQSYDLAVGGNPQRHGSVPEGELAGTYLLVPGRKGSGPSKLANLDEVGYEGDVEILATTSLQMADTGSDSTGGETDTSSPSVQKSFLDAVKRGNLEQVKTFHGQGAKLAICDGKGWTPLHHAARLGKVEVVKYLAHHMPQEALDIVEEEKLQTALHKAAWFGYRDICEILVERGASLTRKDYQGYTPFQKSIQSEDYELMQYLEEHEKRQKTAVDDEEVAI